MNKSMLLNIINSKNYKMTKKDIFPDEFTNDFLYCSNEQLNINLIAKEYTNFSFDEIVQEVIDIRSILVKKNMNIWNTYFLILLEDTYEENENEYQVYSIERNSQGLRKYVIKNENDLYRIPFVKNDKTSNKELDFDKTINEIINTSDTELNNIFKWLVNEEDIDIETKLITKIDKLFIK